MCFRVGRTVVVTWMWDLLWPSSGIEYTWTRSIEVIPFLHAGLWMPVVMFFGRPSSTSAHSAGVEREGGRCCRLCSFCISVCPLAQTEYPDQESGQASCMLRDPEIKTKGKVRRIPIN